MTALRDDAGSVTTTTYLCIGCPIGCRLEVDARDGEVVAVRGASCTTGERYARQEHRRPLRAVSTTVAVTGAHVPRLPVRTAAPVPKERVVDVVRSLAAVEVAAPVRRGDVLVPDVLGLGVDVVATRSLDVHGSAEGLARPSRTPLGRTGTSSQDGSVTPKGPGTPPGRRHRDHGGRQP